MHSNVLCTSFEEITIYLNPNLGCKLNIEINKNYEKLGKIESNFTTKICVKARFLSKIKTCVSFFT